MLILRALQASKTHIFAKTVYKGLNSEFRHTEIGGESQYPTELGLCFSKKNRNRLNDP